jgi:hypothetical protein
VFYCLHGKYDNSISTYLSRFKITLYKIESIEIYFFLSRFLQLAWEFLGLDSKCDTYFFILRTKIIFEGDLDAFWCRDCSRQI